MLITYCKSDPVPAWFPFSEIPAQWQERSTSRNAPDALLHVYFSDEESLSRIFSLASEENDQQRKILVTKRRLPASEHIALLDSGLDDVICWTRPTDVFSEIEEKFSRWRHIESVLQSELINGYFAGTSVAWKNFLRTVIEASLYSSANILLLGESGTGKELLSRLVHTLDQRKNKTQLVLVDCSTISPELSGSEFFGHEKGSYTSAVQSREGAFAMADGGTLFLDEIGELPLRMQAELLRVIQEGTYKKIGSNAWRKTSFRLVAATNRNLQQQVLENQFRSDLFYRVSDIPLRVPSLDERPDDIFPLAVFFLEEYYRERKPEEKVPAIDQGLRLMLESRSYPGNVRELRQLIRRIAFRHTGKRAISMSDVSAADRVLMCETRSDAEEKAASFENMIRREILRGENLFGIKNLAAFLAIKVAMEIESGNQRKAASRLNISTRAIQQYFRKNTKMN